jgi:hypothetical protein
VRAYLGEGGQFGLTTTGWRATVTFEDGSTVVARNLDIQRSKIAEVDWPLLCTADSSTDVLLELRDGQWVFIALR